MKHVKKYNTGIIYECLLKEISSSFVDNKDIRVDLVFNILERHFLSKKAPLKREAMFFALVEGCEQLNESQARQVLVELQKFAEKTDVKKLNEDKNYLINEVTNVLGESVLNHKLENYKILASVEQLLEHYRNIKSFGSSMERIKLENEIINYLTTPRPIQEDVAVAIPSITEGVDKFVLAVAVNNMSKKYNDLSNEQMDIIKESITTKDIEKVRKAEKAKIKEIKSQIDNIKDDDLRKQVIGIVEGYAPIEEFNNDSLIKTLSYFELAKTIKG